MVAVERFSGGTGKWERSGGLGEEGGFVVDGGGRILDVVPVFEALREGPLPGRRLPWDVGISRRRVERAVAVLVSYGLVVLIPDERRPGEAAVDYSPGARGVVRDLFGSGRAPIEEPGAHNEEAVRAVLRMLGVLVSLKASAASGPGGKGGTT